MNIESFYTISCKSGKPLFTEPDAYKDFLTRFNEELAPICTLYAFSLFPQGIEMVVKTTGEVDWENYLRKNNLLQKDFKVWEEAAGMLVVSTLIKNRISGFFRTSTLGGKLIIDPVTEENLSKAMVAVHQAPINAGIAKTLEEWVFSSYNAFLSEKPTRIPRQEVLELVGGVEIFKKLHN